MSKSSYPATGGTQDIFFDRSGAQLLPTIVNGEGVHLIDEDGRRLFDACSGPFLACLGQGNERVLQAMMDQGRNLTYTYSRTTRHQANAELAERLTSLAGFGFERAHLTSGGSEAIEMAIKFLRSHAVATGQSQRTHLISLLPGYHGATFQTIGLNGDVNSRSLWGEMIVYSEKIPAPLTFRSPSAQDAATASLSAFEEAIDRLGGDRILAVLMEPIGGQSSGANVPHPTFARGMRALCNGHGIKLVFDEVVTAFRTGHFLAAHADTEALPDVIVLAKGLGAGYAPLGLALEAADDFLFGGFEAGAFDGETGVGEIGFILFGGDFGLGKGLIEGGLGLAEGGFLLHEGLVSAGGIEFDDGVGLFDAFTGRGHPGDGGVGRHGRVDLNGALGGELAAAADEDQEIALAGGGGGEDGGGLGLAGGGGGGGRGGGGGGEKGEGGPGAEGWGDAGLGDGGIAHCLVSLAGASTTTAAERSGMRWGSDLSSLKTAVKVLIGLPSAEEATGLANSKWAGMARSG